MPVSEGKVNEFLEKIPNGVRAGNESPKNRRSVLIYEWRKVDDEYAKELLEILARQKL
jgi:hypothetical protein